MLGIVIRYYSERNSKIVCTYLGLIELEDGSANSIANAIKKTLLKLKLNTNNLKGVGTDNAAAMVSVKMVPLKF